MNNYCLMTFKSITFVMQFEKLIKTKDVSIKIIPVPRSISTSCGMCAKFDLNMKDDIINLCLNNNIQYNKIFEYE